MAKRKYVLLSEAQEQLDLSLSDIRELIEDEELEGHRNSPTGPLMVAQSSIDDYLDREGDDENDEEDGFDAGYEEGWMDAMAERDSDE